jgi:hypothetical protein
VGLRAGGGEMNSCANDPKSTVLILDGPLAGLEFLRYRDATGG